MQFCIAAQCKKWELNTGKCNVCDPFKGGVPRGASPPPPPGILAFPSIPSTQNAFPLHKTAYAFRDICYIINSYNSWKICLKTLSFTAYILIYHLPSCFTAYILILSPAKLTLLPANEQSPPATIPPSPPFNATQPNQKYKFHCLPL